MADDIDPVAAAAIMEAPAVLSGVTDVQRERLTKKAMTSLHPEEAAEIGQMGEAIEAVERAMRAAEKEIAGALSLTSRDWTEFLDKSTPGDAEPPRLKRYGDEIKVIVEGRSALTGQPSYSARPATPEEIELGVFIDDAA
jgi:hypothetical protein